MMCDYPWHMPRRGAPQAHGPGSVEALADGPDTANTESSFVTCVLAHFWQVTEFDEELTSFSNLAPHSLHSNSKIGMAGASDEISSLQYIEVAECDQLCI
jgi:hypothetical protein